jgi:hypothetical protein
VEPRDDGVAEVPTGVRVGSSCRVGVGGIEPLRDGRGSGFVHLLEQEDVEVAHLRTPGDLVGCEFGLEAVLDVPRNHSHVREVVLLRLSPSWSSLSRQ